MTLCLLYSFLHWSVCAMFATTYDVNMNNGCCIILHRLQVTEGSVMFSGLNRVGYKRLDPWVKAHVVLVWSRPEDDCVLNELTLICSRDLYFHLVLCSLRLLQRVMHSQKHEGKHDYVFYVELACGGHVDMRTTLLIGQFSLRLPSWPLHDPFHYSHSNNIFV